MVWDVYLKLKLLWLLIKNVLLKSFLLKNQQHQNTICILAVAPTKMNDRYEWFLEKATEMGISEITPIICDHSERKFVKTERFDKIIPVGNETVATGLFTKIQRASSF